MNTAALFITLALGGWVSTDADIEKAPTAQSPITNKVAEYHLGAPDWYGAPSPTIDCKADASGGTMTCSGATATPVGSPTTVGSPFYPTGYSAAVAANDPSVGRQNAASLSSSGQYFDFGDAADQTGDHTVCTIFDVSSLSGVGILLGKDEGGGATRGYAMYRSSATLAALVAKNDSSVSTINIGTLVANAYSVACYAYDYVADGTSILRANFNGAAPSEVTNAVGPVRDTSVPFRIGINGSIASPSNAWAGRVSRTTVWTGWAASATQLSQMVASQLGLLATKPAGTVLPFTRADVGFTCPVLDSECYWVGAGVPEIDRRGIWVGGAASNGLAYSNPANWTAEAGVTVTTDSVACPLDPTQQQAHMTLVESATDLRGVYSTGTGGGRSLWMALATGDSACAVDWKNVGGADSQTLILTAAPVRYFSNSAGSGHELDRKTGGCVRWCASGGQVNTYAVPTPFRATTGSAYSGPATTHQGIPPRSDVATWTNLALRSEELDDGAWTTYNGATITANTSVAKDGAVNADRIVMANGDATRYRFLTTPSGATFTAAADVAATSGTASESVIMGCHNVAPTACSCVTEDGRACTATNYNGQSCVCTVTADTTPVRVACTGTCNASITDPAIALHAGAFPSTGGSGEFSHAQLDVGAVANPYCPTGSASATCGSSGGVGKTVTNLATNSENFAAGTWASTNLAATWDAAQDAYRLTDTTDGGAQFHFLTQTLAGAGTWYVALEAKAGTRSWLRTRFEGLNREGYVDLSACTLGSTANGATTRAQVIDGWCRFETSGSAVGATGFTVTLAGGDGTPTYLGTGTGTVFLRRAQVENSTYAGRYCGPTGATSKTCVFPFRAAQPWAVSVTGARSGSWASGDGLLWSWGPYGSANSAGLRPFTDARFYFDVIDLLSPTNPYRIAVNQSFSADSQHTMLASDNGALTLAYDGVVQSPGTTIPNTGAMSIAPATFYLGYGSTGMPLNGWISSWATCKRAGGCR